MYKDFVGRWSVPVPNWIERGAVRRFADAIGDMNPLYRDEAYARSTRHGRLLAPPTFARTFDYGVIEGWQAEEDGLIHGEQTFRFERPLYVGDLLNCSFGLTDIYARNGTTGKMTFLIYEQKGVDQEGQVVFTARMNVIKKEERTS